NLPLADEALEFFVLRSRRGDFHPFFHHRLVVRFGGGWLAFLGVTFDGFVLSAKVDDDKRRYERGAQCRTTKFHAGPFVRFGVRGGFNLASLLCASSIAPHIPRIAQAVAEKIEREQC